MGAYGPDLAAYDPNITAAQDKERKKVYAEWEEHKNSPNCKGENCAICKDFKKRIDSIRLYD